MINLTPLKIVLHFSSLFKVLKIGFFSITKLSCLHFCDDPKQSRWSKYQDKNQQQKGVYVFVAGRNVGCP